MRAAAVSRTPAVLRAPVTAVGRWRRHPLAPRLMAVPLVLGLLVFTAYPLVCLIALSLSRSSLGAPFREWVGLESYADAVTDPVVRGALWRSVLLAVPATLIELVLGLGIALLLRSSVRRGHLVRTLLLLPLMTPPIMVAVVWRLILAPNGGILNATLMNLSLLEQPIAFLAESPWAFLSVILADVWQWTPFVVLLTFAALLGIPEELYEAAHVDGASRSAMLWRITMPMILPALLAVTLLRLIIAFKVFDLVFILTRGGPGFDTTTASFQVWRTALEEFDVGAAAAQTVLFAVLVGVVTWPVMAARARAEGRLQ